MGRTINFEITMLIVLLTSALCSCGADNSIVDCLDGCTHPTQEEESQTTVVAQKGEPGAQGSSGKDGIPGPAGKDGIMGAAGVPGKDGVDGKDGKSAPLVHTLVARKAYSPPLYFDASLTFPDSFYAKIPDFLSVTYGNAGNKTASLKINGVTCTYLGGSSKATPLKPYDAVQAEKGRRYVFQSCTDGSHAGDIKNISSLTLHVVDGDSHMDTEVTASLSEIIQ